MKVMISLFIVSFVTIKETLGCIVTGGIEGQCKKMSDLTDIPFCQSYLTSEYICIPFPSV